MSSSACATATSSLLLRVRDELFRLERHHDKSWLNNASAEQAWEYVQETVAGNTESHWAVVDGVFVMWAVGRQWWAKRPVVAEELVIRIDIPQAGGLRWLRLLEEEAARLGCAGVVLGTSISTKDPAMARLYRMHGYTEQARVIYREL